MLKRGLQVSIMFSNWTRSKFYTKCKSLIKITKVRVEAWKKKKAAVAKYLKNDIADLLRTGFDSNAYGRASGLIVEQNLIAAYSLVDEFCDCITTNLAVLDKQKECPKECKEAIQSLMYAAARLAEFPELRELRSLLAHRYGDCIELYINKQFAELLNPRPATKEMKLQLLGDVAKEFSIDWDPNSLEQKLSRPHQNQHRHGGSNNKPEDGGRDKEDSDGGSAADLSRRREAEVASYSGRKNASDDKMSSGSESTDRDSWQPSLTSTAATTTSATTTSEDESVEGNKIPYRFLPPPYVRTRPVKQDVKTEGSPSKSSPNAAASSPPSSAESGRESQPKPRSVRRRQQMKAAVGYENAGNAESPLKPPPGRAHFGSLDGGSGMIFGRSSRAIIWGESDDEEGDDGNEKRKMDGEVSMQQSKRIAHYGRHNNVRSKLKPLSWRSRDEGASKEGSEHVGSPGSAPPFSSLGKAATGKHARSLSAESSSSGHVHPKLPDYDSLAARIAAFMRK